MLFLRTAVRIQSECLDLFQTKTDIPPDLVQSKLTMRDGGTEEERFNSQDRRCSYVLQIPSSEKMYLAITLHILKKYICGGL